MAVEKTNVGLDGGTLFAASNSALGFYSYYRETLWRDQIKRVYLIKGGPGTGKNRFMRRCAEAISKMGKSVEYYNCSSDPDSLDAVILDGQILMLDATEPHDYDAEFPGIRDEIINLGAFWSGSDLADRYAEIKDLMESKDNCYQNAYRYLSACGSLAEVNRELIAPAVHMKKMRGAIGRMLQRMDDGDDPRCLPGLTDAVSMKGCVKLPTYLNYAEKLYFIEDWYGSGHLFLELLAEQLMLKKLPMRISYDPVTPRQPNGIYLLDSNTAFLISDAYCSDAEKDGVRINMRRFLDAEHIAKVRGEYKANLRLYEAMLSSACDALAKAGEHHFSLERIYSSYMDFTALTRFTASFVQKLCDELT